MKWLRSEEMEYMRLIVNEDVAHDTIQKLGDLGVIQFTDLNTELTPFQRRYVSYVRRCDEMERKLRYFEGELTKFNIRESSPGTVESFIKGSADVRYGSKDIAMRALDTLEHILEEKEQELMQLNSMHEKLTREFNENKELQEIINKMSDFFAIELPATSSTIRTSRLSGTAGFSPLLPEPGTSQEELALRFRNITGVVPSEDRLKFERMIFRTTRGNCYTRFSKIEEPITDPTTGQKVEKQAFVIFYQSQFIETKLRKICDAFHARLYTLPAIDDRTAIYNLMQTNNMELNQSGHILRRNRESCILLCRELAEHLQAWKWTVLQEKATYHTLNLFKADVSGMLRGEGWVVKSAVESVRYEVTRAHSSADKSMPSLVDPVAKPWPMPPTHFEVNKFTDSYQAFVDTYGVPRYREINPAVFTAVTFPFLFGVMYGDIGHGGCLFIAGLYMVLTEKRMKQAKMGEMLGQIYGGRYMILMMGAFAVYAGFIYNDFFALSLNLFGSKYEYSRACDFQNSSTAIGANCEANMMGDPALGDNVYPFGLDPIWKTSEEELKFFNSFKMKLSVILGISQMCFGLLLKGMNALYFREYLDFFFEFIPQMVFTCSLFVYMVFLIVYKWSTDYRQNPDPPVLINTMINIVLSPMEVDNPLYEGQLGVQQTLLLLAGASIPIMLLCKPLILNAIHGKKKRQHVEHHVLYEEEEDVTPVHHGGGHHGEEFEFGEVFIHQCIETIEFVLGMISNTASYLRLWALSLAHSELATVFWEKAMLSTINTGNPLFVFAGFAVFAAVTTGVLLLMDVLECFLHALRLHWVEFQNKFYKADGEKFEPFSFKILLERGYE